MGKGSSAPSADPNIGIAALKQAQLGEDWLSIAKEQFDVANERNDKLDALTTEVTADQLDASKQAQQWAAEDRSRYKSVFQPLQDEFIETANNWDSKERQDTVAAEAKADVINNAAAASAQRSRSMAAMGVSPTSGRYAGVERAADTNTALAAAGAENNARSTTRKEALALKSDAINMGNGLPSQAASSLGLGVSAGSSAAGTTATSNNAYNSSVGILQSGYGTAMSGYASQAQTLSSLYGQQLQAYQLNQQNSGSFLGTLGSIAGTAAGAIISDENLKEDKAPAKGVLAAVREMPVEEWSYKDGLGDEGRHIGTYAQDFKRATGKGDGHSIPIVDAIGVTMGAVKELDAKVQQLSAALPKGRGISREAKPKSASRSVIRKAA